MTYQQAADIVLELRLLGYYAIVCRVPCDDGHVVYNVQIAHTGWPGAEPRAYFEVA